MNGSLGKLVIHNALLRIKRQLKQNTGTTRRVQRPLELKAHFHSVARDQDFIVSNSVRSENSSEWKSSLKAHFHQSLSKRNYGLESGANQTNYVFVHDFEFAPY